MAVAVSFEFFPPSDGAAADQLWGTIRRLAPLRPRFVSVTYGADGATRTHTHAAVLRILGETNLTVAPHLTCVGASREEVVGIAADYWRHGVRRLIALRGDPPAAGSGGRYAPRRGGFAYASDLVLGLKRTADFEIAVAAYPEGHPERPGIAAELENLKRKADAGARSAITQFFFDTDVFLRFRDRCAGRGIGIELIPGILPIIRYAQLMRFADRCGASVPRWLCERFAGLDDEPDTRRLLAAHVAIEQVQRLVAHGVRAFHLYTLNRAEIPHAICHALGLRPLASRPSRDAQKMTDAGRLVAG